MARELLIRRTLIVTMRVPMDAYPGMTEVEAIEYERELPTEDKLESMLSNAGEAEPDLDEVIIVQDVVESPDGSSEISAAHDAPYDDVPCICPHTGKYAQGAAIVEPVRDCYWHGDAAAN